MLHARLVVCLRPLLAQFYVQKNLSRLRNDVFGDQLGHFDGLEAGGINVVRINGVGVHHDGLAKIYGFKKPVAEAFVVAGVADQIGVWK